MVTLSVENYSSRLLDTLGPPKVLRELLCGIQMSETHPSLLQLEAIDFEDEPLSIKFFYHLARSQNLKRLSINIRLEKSLDETRNSKPFDQLERLRIILDAKRYLRSDFHLDIHIGPEDYEDIEEDKLRLFLASLGASASVIRTHNVPNGFAEQVSMLVCTTLPLIDDRATKKFFNSIQSYAHNKGNLSEISCLISKRHLFGNLKTLCLDIPKEHEEQFMSSQHLNFPSGIESLEITSDRGLLVPRHLPGSLRSLALERWLASRWNLYNDPSPGIELVEPLSRIGQSCPFLEELKIDADIVVPSSCFPLTTTLDENSNDAFKSKCKI